MILAVVLVMVVKADMDIIMEAALGVASHMEIPICHVNPAVEVGIVA